MAEIARPERHAPIENLRIFQVHPAFTTAHPHFADKLAKLD
jgi:hypothetical protein